MPTRRNPSVDDLILTTAMVADENPFLRPHLMVHLCSHTFLHCPHHPIPFFRICQEGGMKDMGVSKMGVCTESTSGPNAKTKFWPPTREG